MLGGWAEVLAHGQNLDSRLAEIIHGLKNLRLFFSESEHQAAFGDDVGGDLFHAAEDGEGEAVFGPGTDERGEAFDRLDIVIENIGSGIGDDFEALLFGVKVWGQDFDGDSWLGGSNGFDGAGKVFGAAIAKIIAGDGGDDDMF